MGEWFEASMGRFGGRGGKFFSWAIVTLIILTNIFFVCHIVNFILTWQSAQSLIEDTQEHSESQPVTIERSTSRNQNRTDQNDSPQASRRQRTEKRASSDFSFGSPSRTVGGREERTIREKAEPDPNETVQSITEP